MKGLLLLAFALFIDGLQATLSFMLAGLFASPGAIPLIGPAVATVTVPMGLALGFVINICISLTMGVGLIFLLAVVFGKPSSWIWGGGIADLIPGVNNVPFWTFLTIRAWYEYAQRENKLGALGVAAGLALAPTHGIMSIKEQTMKLPKVKETLSRVGLQQERIAQLKPAKEFNETGRSRFPMQDIRPAQKPNVQPA